MTTDRRDIHRIFCASSEEAQSMKDEDFWEAVFMSTHQFDEEEYPDPDHEDLDDFLGGGICHVCGSVGACGWDMNGLPMVHPANARDTYVYDR